MLRSMLCAAVLAGFVLGAVGCATAPKSENKKAALVDEAQAAIKEMQAADSSLEKTMKSAYGYAVFPSVGKGGIGVGGAYGRGVVFEQGALVGYADLTQASIGLQLGGQSYRELILFQDKAALERFKSGNFSFAANASAVALKSGASAAAKYESGVAVLTKPQGGLMYEASIGGQKFSYQPK